MSAFKSPRQAWRAATLIPADSVHVFALSNAFVMHVLYSSLTTVLPVKPLDKRIAKNTTAAMTARKTILSLFFSDFSSILANYYFMHDQYIKLFLLAHSL